MAASSEIAESPRPRRRRRLLFGNPVVLKELRGRMRGARAFVVLTVYLLLMSGFTALLYVISASTRDIYGFSSGGQIGRTLFVGTVAIELFLVTFIAPAFTAGAISGERERQTYDLLRTTMLPPRSLVMGKLISALSYVFLLLLAAIPLQSIAFLFGGVTEAEVVLASVILLVTAITLGTVGIFFSASTTRTLSANITTYAFTLGLTIGLPLVLFVIISVFGRTVGSLPLNFQIVLYYVYLALLSTNPLAAAYTSWIALTDYQSAGVFALTLTGTTTDPTGATITATTQVPYISPWIPFSILYLLVAVVLLFRAIRRVRRIEV